MTQKTILHLINGLGMGGAEKILLELLKEHLINLIMW